MKKEQTVELILARGVQSPTLPQRTDSEDFVAAGSDQEVSVSDSLPSSDGGLSQISEGAEVQSAEEDTEDVTDSGESQGIAEDAEEGHPETTARWSMASAIADILAHPGPSNATAAPILLGSKSVAKRQREEVEQSKSDRAAKKLRMEMRQRGHLVVPKKGEDPELDNREKLLMKVATRGVVQLFNAISKAQKRQRSALEAGAKAQDAKLSKSSFFHELRGQASQPAIQQPMRRPGEADARPQAGIAAVEEVAVPTGHHASGAGWDVLQDDFGHLQGQTKSKMKDWDKEEDSESAVDEAMSGSESEGNDANSGSESEGGDAW